MNDKRKETPQDRYLKKNLRVFRVTCMRTTEQDLIDFMESKNNISGYIKELIKKDIGNSK